MRITNITPQYFTRFRDENARNVVRKVYTATPEHDFIQKSYDNFFEIIDNCCYMDVYTDSEDNKIKAEFDTMYLRGRFVDYEENLYRIKRYKKNNNLENIDNSNVIAIEIKKLNKKIAASGWYDLRYETEEEQQERRLSYLAQ